MSEVHLTVDRYPSEPDWTLSEYSLLGQRLGVGVEDEYRAVKVHGETRIPNGIYEIDFQPSPKFSAGFYMDTDGNLNKTQSARFAKPHLLLTVLNVPNFSRVLWHWGNTDDDTEGCYCVGERFGQFKGKDGKMQKGVEDSRLNYAKSYPKIYQLWRTNKAAGKKTFVQYRDAAVV